MGSGREVRLRRKKKKALLTLSSGPMPVSLCALAAGEPGSGGTPVCGCREGMAWKAVCLGLAPRDFAGAHNNLDLGVCFCK